jgi:hypothetical protein
MAILVILAFLGAFSDAPHDSLFSASCLGEPSLCWDGVYFPVLATLAGLFVGEGDCAGFFGSEAAMDLGFG